MPRVSAAARTETITYQNQPLSYQLRFRPRRTLGFIVRPDGTVHVSAPRGTAPAWVAAQVLKKADWILKHQTAFRLRPPAPAVSTPAAGTVYYFLGQPRTLTLVNGPKPHVTLASDELQVTTPDPLAAEQIKVLVDAWYRQPVLPKHLPKYGRNFQSLTCRLPPCWYGLCARAGAPVAHARVASASAAT